MNHYETSTTLPFAPQQVFDWHAGPKALSRLLPPWQHIELMDAQGPPGLAVGREVLLKIHLGPLYTHWLARHTRCQEPHLFEDIMVRGPMRKFRHLHHFENLQTGQTRLIDDVHFLPPRGVPQSFVRRDLERMFRFRHARTLGDLQMLDALKTPLKIAISGASGLLGQHLCDTLQNGGHTVIQVSRSLGDVSWDYQKQQIEPLAQLEDLDAFIHLAGENIAARRWSENTKQRIFDSRVKGTDFLIGKLKELQSPPKKFLCASAVGFYPPGTMEEKRLENANPARGFLGETAAAWEESSKAAQEFAEVFNLRFGVILSSRDGALKKMLPAFQVGFGGPLGDGRQPFAWIDLDDAVGSILFLLAKNREPGPYNITAPESLDQHTFARTLGEVLHRPAFMPAPKSAVRLLLGSEMADALLLTGVHAPPEKLQNAGFQFQFKTLKDSLEHQLGVLG